MTAKILSCTTRIGFPLNNFLVRYEGEMQTKTLVRTNRSAAILSSVEQRGIAFFQLDNEDADIITQLEEIAFETGYDLLNTGTGYYLIDRKQIAEVD